LSGDVAGQLTADGEHLEVRGGLVDRHDLAEQVQVAE